MQWQLTWTRRLTFGLLPASCWSSLEVLCHITAAKLLKKYRSSTRIEWWVFADAVCSLSLAATAKSTSISKAPAAAAVAARTKLASPPLALVEAVGNCCRVAGCSERRVTACIDGNHRGNQQRSGLGIFLKFAAEKGSQKVLVLQLCFVCMFCSYQSFPPISQHPWSSCSAPASPSNHGRGPPLGR